MNANEERRILEETVIDIGDTVLCDICNEDYTDRDESGGFIVGTYAYCPGCSRSKELSAREASDTFWCPPWLSFREMVLASRKGDNTIRITAWDRV